MMADCHNIHLDRRKLLDYLHSYIDYLDRMAREHKDLEL